MRKKFALINSVVNIGSYAITLLPVFWIRRVILETLNEQYLGLTSLFQNLIGFLSLAELGIGAAVIYALYKPIAEDDHEKANALLAYFQNAYTKISAVIAVLGIGLMVFFPQVIKTEIPRSTVFIAFLIFLQSTLLSYWFSSRLSLFNVSQRGYVVTGLASGFRVVMLFIQIGALYILKNYFVFLIVQILLDAVFFMTINILAKRYFPWIGKSIQGLTDIEKKELNKNTAAVFCHKLGSFVVLGSDSIIISVFVSLAALGRYSNYNMLFSTAANIIDKIFDGITAGIGNLLATEGGAYSYVAHKRLMFMNFVIVSFISIQLACGTQTFVSLWVGSNYFLDSTTVWLLVFNFYFRGMRSSVERFKQGAGLYIQDWWSPISEAAINLVFALVFVRMWGIAGVLLATVISNLCVVFWVKPLIVYRDVFKMPLRNYFYSYLRYLCAGVLALIICFAIIKALLPPAPLFFTLVRDSGVICLILCMLYWMLFRKTEEFNFYISYLNLMWRSFRKR